MLAAFAALALAAPAPPPKAPAQLQPPAVKLVSVNGGVMTFEISNLNAAPLPYSGYTPESFSPCLREGTVAPWYSLELRRGGAWKPVPMLRCKTGKGPVSVPARGKATFDVYTPAGDWDEVRVGLTWFRTADHKEPAVAWSAGVNKGLVELRRP
jgi:hypothetical protein